jgi:hypothetical protein
MLSRLSSFSGPLSPLFKIPVGGFTADGLILRYVIGDNNSYSGTTTVTDLVGNSNATLVNGPTYSINGYLNLDGVNDYVINNTSLNSKLSPATSSTVISYFTWIYPQDNGVIVSEQGTYSLNSGWHYSPIEMISENLKFGLWIEPGGVGSISNLTSSISTPLNNWYYVGLTYDGEIMRTYVNGQSAGTKLVTRVTPATYSQGLYYGIGVTDGTNMGDGSYAKMKFGDFHVYNTALSSQQVLNNYNSTKNDYIYTDDKILFWIDANDSQSYTGSLTLTDLSGNSYNHTLSNGATFSTILGVKCFDCSTSTRKINIGSGPVLSNTGYTYVIWGKILSWNTSWRTLVTTSTTVPITIQITNDNLGLWNGGFVDSGFDITQLSDKWVQYSIVGDSSSQTFYINDTEVGSISSGAGGGTHVEIGNNGLASQPFGYIGNAILYDAKLTQQQIKQNFSALKHVYPNIETFTSVGPTTWTAPYGVTTVEYLVVGGGGGGGNAYDNSAGGGGGAGMVLTGTTTVVPGQSYTVIVGVGGAGGSTTYPGSSSGSVGGSSVFSTVTAFGGAAGFGTRQAQSTIGSAQVGTSISPTGGGGGGGGTGGKGGGGATGNGTTNSGTTGGVGGSGLTSSISGTSIVYGVGGSSANSGSLNGSVNGTTNRGNGGQAAGAPSGQGRNGGNGGSGIVIIKYY